MSRTLVLVFALFALVPLAADDTGIAGGWRLNPELGYAPQAAPEARGPRPGGRGPGVGGGRPGGGFGGGMGRGGRGTPGMGGGPSEDDRRRMQVVRRRLAEAPAKLVIVRDGDAVIVTDGDGRSTRYTADGRKEERVTGDGEFATRARFEDDVLSVEEDFGGGVKLTTRYAPATSEERPRLEVSLSVSGLPRGGRAPSGNGAAAARDGVTRVYERDER